MTAIFDTADSAYLDTDEGRFQLHIHGSDGKHYIFDIHADAVGFYENVQAELGGYAREALEAKQAVRRGVPLPVFTKVADVHEAVEAGYALDDPKSPGYHDRMVGDA